MSCQSVNLFKKPGCARLAVSLFLMRNEEKSLITTKRVESLGETANAGTPPISEPI